MHRDIQEVLFTSEQIAERVQAMGEAITADYSAAARRGEGIVMMCVLRGAAIFMADLARRVKLPMEMDYMAVSSYGSGVKSSGVVNITKDLSGSIEGKHLIIAEDVIDTGLTLTYLLKNLRSRNPLSIEIAAMLRKDVPRPQEIPCKYLGFDCGDEFVVGYGLDFAERYRNLPDIGILKPEIYQ
ncbi:MAG: hypoxanthine phosphoribosyltransferase [Eggerthellaceae bacterium]|nr:hypoxanthine phosphoribosyltransferase [Eggerthellaceae bacterium]